MLRGTGSRFGARARAVVRAPLTLVLLLCLVFVGFSAVSASAQIQPGRRVALVIGNATYTNGGVLDNPEADADVVAARLESLGFLVTSDKNLGQSGMRDLIGAFMSRIRDNDLVLIYYAGHGVEADGRDYMLPVDVKLETPSAVQFQGIPLDMLYSDRQTFGVIIVFDACRDNPFLRRVKGDVAGTHALSPPVGALVLFSASSGDVAEDGGFGPDGNPRRNSVFADAFVHALSVPDASIQKIYQTILREVRTQTSNRQAPQRFGDLADDFTFYRTGAVYAQPPRPVYAAAPPQPAPQQSPGAMQFAAAQQAGAPGATYRSLPTQEDPAAASTEELAPPGGFTAPAPGPPPQQLAVATPPPRVVATPPAPAETYQAPPDYAPKPADAPAASASAPSATVAPPPAPAPTTFAAPPASTPFTIASLGENVLPQPPQLAPVPQLTLPARFCSIEAQIDYLNNTFKPAYDIAYRDNEAAIAYLAGLNALGQEYNARGSGFVFRIKAQFDAFAPLAAKANETSNAVLALDAQIRRIPVESC